MNSKKFISLISAAALTASSFAALPVFGADSDTVIFTDTFNKYENAITHQTSPDGVGQVFLDGTANADTQSKEIPGLTLHTTNRSDDSSYYQMVNKDEEGTDKYLMTTVSRFSSASRGAKIVFDNAQTPEAGKDVVVAFDVLMANEGGTGYDEAFAIGGTIFDMASNNINDGEWHSIKAVASTTGTKIYVDGDPDAFVTSSNTSVDNISFIGYVDGVSQDDAQKSTSHPFGYITFGIDNLVLYTSADGAASTVPGATDNNATPAPTPTAPPPAAEITKTTTVDFDDNTLEKAGVVLTNHADYTTANELIAAGSTTNVLEIAQTSNKVNSYGYATLDFSSLTEGKSHVILDYDIYVGSSGRVKTVIQDGPLSASSSESLGGIFTQGITKGGDTGTNCVADAWVHTTLDVDLASGTGTYKVTQDETEVKSGNITTDLTALTTLSLVSWSANTSYIDNLVIQTGGESEGPVLATQEPASEADGSGIDIMPADALYIGDMSDAAAGDEVVKLNHDLAQQIVEATGINAYSDKARGKSIYAAYDVYLAPGSSTSIVATGDSGKAVSSTMKLTTNKDNTVTVSADTDKGTVTAEQKLVADTWYRVLVEVPQSGTSDATATDKLTFTVYRIDADDPTQVKEVAAQLTDLSPRGVASRGVTAFNIGVTGDAYMDNSSVYIYTTGFSYLDTPAAGVTPEPAGTEEGSYVELAPADARALFNPSPIMGDATAILNHSEAVPAVAASVDTYSDKAKGYSIFAAYDVYVAAGDKLTLAAYGDSGKALGTQFVLTGNEDGTATATALVDKGDTVNVGTVANNTWYRVVIEVPQTSDGATGNATYTIYRINPENPEETLEVAAQKNGLTPRNLSGRGMTSLVTTVEGTPYIDNVAVYLAQTNVSLKDVWTKYEVEYDANGRVTLVISEPVADPSTVDTTENTDTFKTFVWNGLQQPYTAE